MNKRFLKNILILLLASTLVFAAFRYISYLKGNIRDLESQKQNLLQELAKEKNTLEQLKLRNDSLKDNLIAIRKRLDKSFVTLEQLKLRNDSLKDNLIATRKRLDKSFVTLSLSEKKIEELISQVAILKADNSALLGDKLKLVQENEAFKVKLTSIPELKAAIRELKRLARVEGNRGFLIKSGKSTFTPKVKIEVVPAPGK